MQSVLARASWRKQMHDRVSTGDEPVGDVPAMAVGRIAFRAHHADALRALGERSRRLPERRALHVLGVGYFAIAA